MNNFNHRNIMNATGDSIANSNLRRAIILLVTIIGITCFSGVGCKTNQDPENMSARPWNSPQTWEHGVPAAIYEGR